QTPPVGGGESRSSRSKAAISSSHRTGGGVSAGTNDIALGRSPQQIRDDFLALVAALRKDLPDVKVAFLAIAPSIRRWDQRDRQEAANDAVKLAVESGGPGLAYIDANAAFLGPDGRPAAECFLDDHQHPSTIGNARRAAVMRPALERLLGQEAIPAAAR
ncbi:MAG: GDSL-type esterase/lipase family protein, partial [Planctomycetia bacterium]